MPRGKEVVVYCVYGRDVGQATSLRLRAQIVKARCLRGGIDGAEAAGRPVDPKGTESSSRKLQGDCDASCTLCCDLLRVGRCHG